MDAERLVVGSGPVLEETEGDGLPKQQGGVRVASPVDAGVDPVTETDVVSELGELTVDGYLPRIRARVGQQRKSIVGRHQRIWDHEVAVEEELQNSYASARDRAVSCRVGRMRRRAFRKRLGKQPRPILVETLLKSLRLQDHWTQSDIGLVAVPGLNQVDDTSDGLWPRTEVHKPFLVPDGIQSLGRNFADGPREIGPTERAEAVF